MVRYVECRTLLAGETVLRVVITAPARYWAIDRGLTAKVLSAIEMPVWSPESGAAVSPAGLSLPPEVETPEVPALGCGALLTLDDADLVLAALERHRAGLDGDLLSFAGGEVCSQQIASDEAMFVRIEPGHPGDFESGAELLGVPGHGVRAFGREPLRHGPDGTRALRALVRGRGQPTGAGCGRAGEDAAGQRGVLGVPGTAIKTSARPQVEADWLDGWTKQPTEIPVWPGDEHDRILIIPAVGATSIPFEVTDVDDAPECESDDPLAPSDALDAWCELPCEASAFFPPLSDPVDASDSWHPTSAPA